MSLSNREISELLASAAVGLEGHRRKAYERAAAAALGWGEEVAALVEAGRSPSELPSIGKGLSAKLLEWFEDPPEIADPPPDRAGFMTRAEVESILEGHRWRSRAAGDLQMHTVYSDGKLTVAELTAAAISAGRTYIAVTDHSTGQPVPRGMDMERAEDQARDLAEVEDRLAEKGTSFAILHGIEMNLTPAGEPALAESERRRFAWVIGSFHSALRTEADQTTRYLAAIRHAGIHAVGHPTCRRFGRRVGLQAQWEKVFAAAAEAGVAVEINAHPHRQDLPVDLARVAAEAGCWFTIGTDAHYPEELENFDFGLAIAAAAGIPEERILNFKPVEELLEWIRTHHRKEKE